MELYEPNEYHSPLLYYYIVIIYKQYRNNIHYP